MPRPCWISSGVSRWPNSGRLSKHWSVRKPLPRGSASLAAEGAVCLRVAVCWRRYWRSEPRSGLVVSGVLLDTSAFLAWSQDEPGAEEVEMYFREAMDGQAALHASFVTLTEMEYITTRSSVPTKPENCLNRWKSSRWHGTIRTRRCVARRPSSKRRITSLSPILLSPLPPCVWMRCSSTKIRSSRRSRA